MYITTIFTHLVLKRCTAKVFEIHLTLVLPPFFHPVGYRRVENDTEGFTAALNANNA